MPKKLTGDRKQKVIDKALEWAPAKRKVAPLAKQEETLKEDIKGLLEGYELPYKDKSSEYLEVAPGIVIGLTRPGALLEIDAEEFRKKVGEKVFARVMKPIAFELDPKEWEAVVKEEAASENMLRECITEKERSPSLSLRATLPDGK